MVTAQENDPRRHIISPSQSDKKSPPPGWTDDDNELQYDYYWADDKSDGKYVAAKHGLKNPRPVMCSTRQSGDALYMFSAKEGDKDGVYVWNQIEGNIFRITNPSSLDAILGVMWSKEGGLGTLGMQQVEQGANVQ